MKDSQKPNHVSLANTVSRLREGRYVIPDCQGDSAWEPGDIDEPMRSIFRDCYGGSLLLWQANEKNLESLSRESVYAFKGGNGRTNVVSGGR